MTTFAKPYLVTLMWDPDTSIALWSAIAPTGELCTIRYTLEEIEMMTGERPFPPRGLRRVVRDLLRPVLPVRGPSLPGPWAKRDSVAVQERVERWGRSAGIEWARKHAWKRHQRMLDEDDIVFECVIDRPGRHPAEGRDLR